VLLKWCITFYELLLFLLNHRDLYCLSLSIRIWSAFLHYHLLLYCLLLACILPSSLHRWHNVTLLPSVWDSLVTVHVVLPMNTITGQLLLRFSSAVCLRSETIVQWSQISLSGSESRVIRRHTDQQEFRIRYASKSPWSVHRDMPVGPEISNLTNFGIVGVPLHSPTAIWMKFVTWQWNWCDVLFHANFHDDRCIVSPRWGNILQISPKFSLKGQAGLATVNLRTKFGLYSPDFGWFGVVRDTQDHNIR